LVLTEADHDLLGKVNRALGRLDSLATLLPDTQLFVYMYVRKEAVLSSQIEGTQSSISDLLIHELAEAPGVPIDDVVEVSNYVRAMTHGLERMRSGFPLSLRLLCEIHGLLLQGARGQERNPGEFRRSQVWIGGTRPGNATFVPPPSQHLMECLGPFEKFLHDDPVRVPLLIKAALAHAQFETIHPFLDGNGRLGRLLITLLMCAEDALSEPLLYLSLYFKQHRDAYYAHLQRIRTHGDWESWVRFFLEGVKTIADEAVDTAKSAISMFDRDRRRVRDELGRAAGSALQVHEALTQHPILSIAVGVARTQLSGPTVDMALRNLTTLGLVREITGRRRNRLFTYVPYLALLSDGAGNPV
jgi:Fic family protein